MMRLILRVKKHQTCWRVSDETLTIDRPISPKSLPTRVRRDVEINGGAYFYGAIIDNKLAFGDRYRGDPGWL